MNVVDMYLVFGFQIYECLWTIHLLLIYKFLKIKSRIYFSIKSLIYIQANG